VVLAVFRDQRTEGERFEADARDAAEKMVLFKSGKSWSSARLIMDKVMGQAHNAYYKSNYFQSVSNLIRSGHAVERTFKFQHGTDSWKAFSAALPGTFPEEFYNCSFKSEEAAIIVVARPARMARWEQLVQEYDKPKGP
jgi:hypothetical protein